MTKWLQGQYIQADTGNARDHTLGDSKNSPILARHALTVHMHVCHNYKPQIYTGDIPHSE